MGMRLKEIRLDPCDRILSFIYGPGQKRNQLLVFYNGKKTYFLNFFEDFEQFYAIAAKDKLLDEKYLKNPDPLILEGKSFKDIIGNEAIGKVFLPWEKRNLVDFPGIRDLDQEDLFFNLANFFTPFGRRKDPNHYNKQIKEKTEEGEAPKLSDQMNDPEEASDSNPKKPMGRSIEDLLGGQNSVVKNRELKGKKKFLQRKLHRIQQDILKK